MRQPATVCAATVCVDPAVAATAVAAGTDVVLVTASGAPGPAADRRPGEDSSPDGAGRLAVFVGDPDSAVDLAAAAEMASEVFARKTSRNSPRREHR